QPAGPAHRHVRPPRRRWDVGPNRHVLVAVLRSPALRPAPRPRPRPPRPRVRGTARRRPRRVVLAAVPPWRQARPVTVPPHRPPAPRRDRVGNQTFGRGVPWPSSAAARSATG